MKISKKFLLVVTIIISLVAMSGCTNSSTALSVTNAKGAGSISFTNTIPNVLLKVYGTTSDELVETLNDMNSIDSMTITADDSSDGDFLNLNYTLSFDSIEEYNLQMSALNDETLLMFDAMFDDESLSILEDSFDDEFDLDKDVDVDYSEFDEDYEVFEGEFDEDYEEDESFEFEPAVICEDDAENSDKLSLIVPAYHSYIMFSWNTLVLYFLTFTCDETDYLQSISELEEAEYEYNSVDMDAIDMEDEDFNIEEAASDLSDEDSAELKETLNDYASSKISTVLDDCDYSELEEELATINDDSSELSMSCFNALCDLSQTAVDKCSNNSNKCDKNKCDKNKCDKTTKAPATKAPATEAPATEAPATEAPATEAPATEAPATEAVVTEAPATEAPATEAVVTEAPATEAPATEAVVTKAPATETPATKAAVTEAPATETSDDSELATEEDLALMEELAETEPTITFNMTFGSAKLDEVDVLSYEEDYFVLSTTFTELEKASANSSSNLDDTPKTADNSAIFVVTTLAVLSLGVLIISRKKAFN